MKDRETQQTFERLVENDPELFWPIQIELAEKEMSRSKGKQRLDLRLELSLNDKRQSFVVEIESTSTPKSVDHKIRQVRGYSEEIEAGDCPALLVRHLSEKVAQVVKDRRMSALDLNGNYIIQTPEFAAVRLDQKNRFPRSRQIKNVYRGTTSLVGRFLLQGPTVFEKVQEIHDGIVGLGGNISLSTVSKALSGLDDDLLIHKERGKIRLTQPSELLSRLQSEYRQPKIQDEWRLQLPEDREEQEEWLTELSSPWLWTGITSAELSTSAPADTVAHAYTRPFESIPNRLKACQNRRFYNCVLKETDSDFVFFGQQDYRADDVQCYLELANLKGDSRAAEIAKTYRENILTRFRGTSLT
jgi:hypothetical protein